MQREMHNVSNKKTNSSESCQISIAICHNNRIAMIKSECEREKHPSFVCRGTCSLNLHGRNQNYRIYL